MNWKKGLAAGMAGLMIVSMAGCGKKAADGNTSETADSKKEVVVTVDRLFETKDYAAEDYVTLGEYKNLPVELQVKTVVSQEELDDYIEAELEENEEYKELDRAAKMGDLVTIDFDGKIGGKEFEDGSAEDYELELGSNEFIDGFEKGIVGMKAGEKKTLNLTFPEDYDDEEVAGKAVQFEVTLNSVMEVITPEYNDDFISTYTECSNKEEYEKQCRQQILDEFNQSAIEDAKAEVWQTAVDNANVDGYPESEYEEAYANVESEYQSMAEMFGGDPENFMEDWGLTEEDVKEAAISEIQENLVMYAIAKQEGITLDTDEFEEYLKKYSDENEMTTDEMKEAYGEEELHRVCLYDAVVDYVYQNASVTEIAPEEEDESEWDESDESDESYEDDDSTIELEDEDSTVEAEEDSTAETEDDSNAETEDEDSSADTEAEEE